MASQDESIKGLFHDLMESIQEAANNAPEEVKKIIDERVKGFEEEVKKNSPSKTGGLRESFGVELDNSKDDWYGYDWSFKGEAQNGEPYEKIANIRNYGDENQAGSMFVSKSFKKLKGMSAAIDARIDKLIEESTKNKI